MDGFYLCYIWSTPELIFFTSMHLSYKTGIKTWTPSCLFSVTANRDEWSIFFFSIFKVSVIDSTSECKWILTYLSESAKCSAQLISITELWRNSDWRRPSWDAEQKALRGHISRFFPGQTDGITSYNHSSYTALNICSHNTTPSFLSHTGEGYSDLELSSHSFDWVFHRGISQEACQSSPSLFTPSFSAFVCRSFSWCSCSCIHSP